MSAAGTKEAVNFSQPARISSMVGSLEILLVRSFATSLWSSADAMGSSLWALPSGLATELGLPPFRECGDRFHEVLLAHAIRGAFGFSVKLGIEGIVPTQTHQPFRLDDSLGGRRNNFRR